MFYSLIVSLILYKTCSCEFNIESAVTTEEIQLLNELSVEKLIQLKNSFKGLEQPYDNSTVTTPDYLENFGAQAMAIRAPPIKRTDYEEGLYKKEDSKISNIFTMSVTTLAFLAFGGYLLCLIVHAVKSKQNSATVVTPQPTFFVNSGIKRPQTQFGSYGRKRRDVVAVDELLPPDEMFSALLQVCEGYAKWSIGNKH